MTTFIVTLVARTEVPVIAKTEAEAIEKARQIVAYDEAVTRHYSCNDEYYDYPQDNHVDAIIDNSVATDEAKKNEEFYQTL